jgi:uncharacterized membrane protein
MKLMKIAACVAALGFAGQSYASDISNDTLAAMGLSGATIVSDAEAMEVRGMGYMGGGHGVPSFSLAAGGSIAYVGEHKAGAGTANVYFGVGPNGAGGENFSEAGKTMKHSKTVKIGGKKIKTVHVKSLHVFAGGYSSSFSY